MVQIINLKNEGMIDYNRIIDKFYPEASKLRDILLVHSKGVCRLALEIVEKHPELNADRDIVKAGAMLHDIGIIRCDAPGIECFGTEPYICHGTIGARMLREDDLADFGLKPADVEPFARICERHTGAGLTLSQIISQNLPLPHIDLCPETIEEQIVCYADKFFSKTHPERQKTYEQAMKSLAKFGESGLLKFAEWQRLFGR